MYFNSWKKGDPDFHLKLFYTTNLSLFNPQFVKTSNCQKNRQFFHHENNDLSQHYIYKNFRFLVFTCVFFQFFKKVKTIHFTQIPLPCRESWTYHENYQPTNQPTNSIQTNVKTSGDRSKSGSNRWRPNESPGQSVPAIPRAWRAWYDFCYPQPANDGPPRSLVAGYESDINRGQAFQDCSNSFRPVINL